MMSKECGLSQPYLKKKTFFVHFILPRRTLTSSDITVPTSYSTEQLFLFPVYVISHTFTQDSL